MHDTAPRLLPTSFPPIKRGRLESLQVNLGYRCNQQCLHCHVNASPQRKEMMSDDVLTTVLAFLQKQKVSRLDLTGGAPEMHSGFRDLVSKATAMGVQVLDRCNLTILEEPGQEDLADFLAEHNVEVVASLPCYLEENVDAQRGDGVFAKSLAGLKRLNSLGYGQGDPKRQLSLVFNPQGPSLPPPQVGLELDYKRELQQRYNIQFDSLLTIANMPIKRFGSTLISKGQFDDYLDLLRASHSDENVAAVMCRSLISVDWQGYVYDCDFNQMLDFPIPGAGDKPHLRELLDTDFNDRPITIAEHCYGCTAGQGSSCGGALS